MERRVRRNLGVGAMSDIPVKMGRPRLDPDATKAKPLCVYVTSEERETLAKLAEQQGRSISALARILIKRGMKP